MLAASHYGCGAFEEAVAAADIGLQADPNTVKALLIATAANVALGHMAAAHKAVRAILAVQPDFNLQSYAERQPYKNSHDLEQLLSRLHQAGL